MGLKWACLNGPSVGWVVSNGSKVLDWKVIDMYLYCALYQYRVKLQIDGA